jgi:hypothetical protein
MGGEADALSEAGFCGSDASRDRGFVDEIPRRDLRRSHRSEKSRGSFDPRLRNDRSGHGPSDHDMALQRRTPQFGERVAFMLTPEYAVYARTPM